jgi:tRNA pseudouridine65 synthase
MLDILYRDDYLVAIHKPAGLLVHRSNLDRHETRFAVQLLRDQIGRHVYPAHRLDKGTSGLLLFALDGNTVRALGQQFETGAVEKTYRAIVRGWPPEMGCIDHPLSRQFDDHGRPRTDAATASLPAQTEFRRLASAEIDATVDRYPTARYALVELRPLTGRQHQLRRHMKHIAHPIIGDATHGKGRHNRFFQEHFNSHRLLLACTELRLRHPVNGTLLLLQAPPAADFSAVATALGWDG